MRGLIIFAVLLSAVSGYRSSSYIAQQRPRDVTEEPTKETVATTIGAATTISAAKPSTSILTTTAALPSTAPPVVEPIPEELVSELPVSSVAPASVPDDDNYDASKRRIITYDQRQEGQYNIRADLENFMIVLIPPSPAEGLSLLDFLTKSSLRRNSHTTKSKRKHSFNAIQPGAAKYRHSLRAGNNNQNFNYLLRQPATGEGVSARGYAASAPYTHSQPVAIVESSLSQGPLEFIEGRTPYHVDISSNDELQSRVHPDRPVDVLPPPYPLAYQHLIKPFHLDAEPTVIQALPPDVKAGHASGNFLETYNQLLASGLQNNAEAGSNLNIASDGSGYYRVSRAIRGDNYLDSSRVSASNSLGVYPTRRSHFPIYRSDLSFGAGTLYPPIDVPHLPSYLTVDTNSRSFELNSEEDREQSLDEAHIGEIIVPPSFPAEDDLELDSHSISFIDADAKALLSDGMERCAPGHRRDSYGVCREIEGY